MGAKIKDLSIRYIGGLEEWYVYIFKSQVSNAESKS